MMGLKDYLKSKSMKAGSSADTTSYSVKTTDVIAANSAAKRQKFLSSVDPVTPVSKALKPPVHGIKYTAGSSRSQPIKRASQKSKKTSSAASNTRLITSMFAKKVVEQTPEKTTKVPSAGSDAEEITSSVATLSDKPKGSPEISGVKRARESLEIPDELLHDPKADMINFSPQKINTSVTLPTTPAYKRYAHLVAPKKAIILKNLPASFEKLEKMFLALETVLLFNKARCQSSIFDKIKKAVENICHRSFDVSHLAQIMTILPNAYDLSPVRYTDESGERIQSIVISFPRPAVEDYTGPEAHKFHFQSLKFDRDMKYRKKQFKDNMFEIIGRFHQEYLSTNNLKAPVGDIWHDGFDVETVPEPEKYVIPFLAKKTVTPIAEVKGEEKKMVDAASEVKEPDCFISDEKPGKPLTKYEAMLERIRAKEQKKNELLKIKPAKNAAQNRELMLMSRIAEVIRCVHFYFIQERRPGMLMNELIPHLVNSHKVSITARDMIHCVRKISELNPDICTILKLSTGEECVRWKRDNDLQSIITNMENYKKSL